MEKKLCYKQTDDGSLNVKVLPIRMSLHYGTTKVQMFPQCVEFIEKKKEVI